MCIENGEREWCLGRWTYGGECGWEERPVAAAAAALRLLSQSLALGLSAKFTVVVGGFEQQLGRIDPRGREFSSTDIYICICLFTLRANANSVMCPARKILVFKWLG